MKVVLSAEQLKKLINTTKIVKPMSGDYVLKVSDGKLHLCSSDKRHISYSVVQCDAPRSFESEDAYLSTDRLSIIEPKSDSVTFNFADTGLTVKQGDKSATIRKRSDASKKKRIRYCLPDKNFSINSKKFDSILKAAGVSASVKDTKTEEQMRINQVHFYSKDHAIVSNSRFYASCVNYDSLTVDLSVVSSDIPILRNFCQKVGGENQIDVSFDERNLYLSDPTTGSYVQSQRVKCNVPPYSHFVDSYSVTCEVNPSLMKENVAWAMTALEGTNRISFRAMNVGPDGKGYISISTPKEELCRFECRFLSGNEIIADYPLNILSSVVSNFDSGTMKLKFGHFSVPTVLEIEVDDGEVIGRHFIQSMKAKND